MNSDEPVIPAEPVVTETFEGLGLSPALVETLKELGYETPTPIQMQSIPHLLTGRDVIGQAQTGTGKTAAFALPILQQLDLTSNTVQALLMTPTRELAIQVAEAIHTYSKRIGRVRVMPIYGGDPISKQISRLRGGIQIVVGTPGRIMDHLRRGTLDLQGVKMVALDEADEMLKMGFIDDVEWILSQVPKPRQIALFSATMPKEVRRIADRHLVEPANVEIRLKARTVPLIDQHYIQVPEQQKLNALTHLLETEGSSGEATLIFARTKVRVADIAEKLEARGYAAEAMHGDMNQSQRENVVRRIKTGELEIVVATDVAARGLDVERISHVINFDIPYDEESYVHRIGRTGRAGRKGKAIVFVTPREGRMLQQIERFTGQRITSMKMPTRADVAARRMALFKERILKSFETDGMEAYLSLVEEIVEESGRDLAEVAAAALRLASSDRPVVVPLEPKANDLPPTEDGMVRLMIESGRRNNVHPADIVGAIANEADVPGKSIGAIDIYDDFTIVEVPAQFSQQILAAMTGTTIRGRIAKVRIATGSPGGTHGTSGSHARRGTGGPKRDMRHRR